MIYFFFHLSCHLIIITRVLYKCFLYFFFFLFFFFCCCRFVLLGKASTIINWAAPCSRDVFDLISSDFFSV